MMNYKHVDEPSVNDSFKKSHIYRNEKVMKLEKNSKRAEYLHYNATKSSAHYISAKSYLHNGDFETALSTIEEALMTKISLIPDKNELDESLAPLYYLYGTTLLYSIEESPDAECSIMDFEELDEDLQISWENLEMARSIISCVSPYNGNMSPYVSLTNNERELLLDLAQVHMRLGDLSRHNGQYIQSIEEYETCSTIRRSILGTWDRKVADVEYSIGTVCLLTVAEGEKQHRMKINSPDELISMNEIEIYREKSIQCYMECGRIMGGIIGILCGKKAEDIACTNSIYSSLPSKERASLALNKIRKRVSNLVSSDEKNRDTVNYLKELLDEIQEAIDTCDSDCFNLKDVNEVISSTNTYSLLSNPVSEFENRSNNVDTITVGVSSQIICNESFTNTTSNSMLKGINNTSSMMVVKKKKKRKLEKGKINIMENNSKTVKYPE